MKKPGIVILVTSIVVVVCAFTASTIFSQKTSSRKVKHNAAATTSTLRDGDIIFQSSTTGQSLAVQLATHSPYSHCGIIRLSGGKTYVCEAVGPVKLTAIDEWAEHGDVEHYVVKRLKNADQVLTPGLLKKMQAIEDKYDGKPYDIYFEWNDDKIYCSELVWKVYKEGAGIEIGKLQHLKDFDLSSREVKTIMHQRYGDTPPLNETVISPSSIFEDPSLVTVMEN